MKFSFKKKPKKRSIKLPSEGHSLSTNNYYRPKNTSTAIPKKRESQSEPKRKISLDNIINAFLVLFVVGLLLFGSTLSTAPTVTLDDTAYSYRNESEYSDFASEYMKQSLANRSKLLFRSTNLENAMIKEFPEIDTVSAIVPIGGRHVTLVTNLSEPLVELVNDSERGVVDSTGVVVGAEVQAENLPVLRFATPQQDIAEGSPVLTTDEVGLLHLLLSELDQSVSLPDTAPLVVNEILFNVADGQMELRFVAQDFYVKYSVYADAQVQVGTMLKSFEQLAREGKLPISYIDVRIPGKVYIK